MINNAKAVIILGSSRSDGNMASICNQIAKQLDLSIIDLSAHNISPYDYEHNNEEDDFLPLIESLISDYEIFIFATPVYWYAMSATLKIFFDRLSDLLTIRKELGRKLRNKDTIVVTSSIGNHLGNDFWLPFYATFNYLGMNFKYHTHFLHDSIEIGDIKSIQQNIKKAV